MQRSDVLSELPGVCEKTDTNQNQTKTQKPTFHHDFGDQNQTFTVIWECKIEISTVIWESKIEIFTVIWERKITIFTVILHGIWALAKQNSIFAAATAAVAPVRNRRPAVPSAVRAAAAAAAAKIVEKTKNCEHVVSFFSQTPVSFARRHYCYVSPNLGRV